MAAGDTANPRVWQKMLVYTGTIGTTAPTDVTTAPAAGWKDLGLLSEDGLTEGLEEDRSDLYAYGQILVRTVRSRHRRTFGIVVLEDNPTVFALRNPGSTQATATGLTTRVVKVPITSPQAFLIHQEDGTYKRRVIVPRGEVTENGERTFTEVGIPMMSMTVTVYPASNGDLYTEITTDPAAVTT